MAWETTLTGDLALFARAKKNEAKFARFFIIIGMIVAGAFVVSNAMDISHLGDNKATRFTLASAAGLAFCVFMFIRYSIKPKGVRLLENPDEIASYKIIFVEDRSSISAIWITNKEGKSYEMAIAFTGTEDGAQRALEAFKQHVPHAEPEQHVVLTNNPNQSG